jgi:hypothetical protein
MSGADDDISRLLDSRRIVSPGGGHGVVMRRERGPIMVWASCKESEVQQ